MLNRRITSAALAAGLAVLMAVFAYGVFGPGLPLAYWSSAPPLASPTKQISPLARSWNPLSINRHGTLDLQLAPMHSLDETEIKRQRARKSKVARAAKRKAQGKPQLISPDSVPPIQRPLDLSLPPPGLPMIANIPTPRQAPSASARTTPSRRHADQATLNSNAGVGRPQFEADHTNKLFNRNNGLRGFMKQSWVNQSLGFQGGLAIKSKRLRENNSDLRDNMAVGMGVLLAF